MSLYYLLQPRNGVIQGSTCSWAVLGWTCLELKVMHIYLKFLESHWTTEISQNQPREVSKHWSLHCGVPTARRWLFSAEPCLNPHSHWISHLVRTAVMEKEVSQLVSFIKGMGVIATISFFHPSSLPGFALTTLESKKLYSEHRSTFGSDICNQCMPWELGSL